MAKAFKNIGGSFQLEFEAEGFPLDIVMPEDKVAIEVPI